MLLINGHKVSQVICLMCLHRWIAARPVETRLDELECPHCGNCNCVIETGDTTVTEDLLNKAREE